MKNNYFKYPIEIEFTDFCSLKCKYCINPLLENKGFISDSNFDYVLDYIFQNKEKILYINFAGIGDIFLHPKKNIFFEKIKQKFKNTNIKILIPTKGNSVKDVDMNQILELINSGININISIGIFSMNSKINDAVMGRNIFHQIINFMKKCNELKIPFSLELLNNNSEKEKKIFEIFIKKLNIGGSFSSYHNFAGNIKLDKLAGNNYCNFEGETYILDNFYCSFIPFISKSGNLYSCSISGKNKNFFIGNIKEIFQKFPDFEYLVLFIKKDFLSSEKCKKCSIYQDFYAKK